MKQVEHHAALDWREAPAFMAELASREGAARQGAGVRYPDRCSVRRGARA